MSAPPPLVVVPGAVVVGTPVSPSGVISGTYVAAPATATEPEGSDLSHTDIGRMACMLWLYTRRAR